MSQPIKMSAVLSLVFLFIVSSPGRAPAAIPPGDASGALGSRFQADSERERKALESKKVKKPSIEVEKEAPGQEAAEGPSFLLKDIRVTGQTVFDPKNFRPLYENYLNKSATFQDLKIIADKITAMYKARGYFTTTAYIPEQQVAEGVVEIRIVEGRLGEVTVEGNKFFSTRLIKSYLSTKKNEILSLFRLQRELLRLNQNSDLEVKTVLSAGREPGTSDLALKVKDRFPYHVGTSVDNQGTRLVGKYRNAFSVRSTNFLGLNDSLFFNTLMGANSSGNYVNYSIPVGVEGVKYGVEISIFDTLLGKEYKALDITGNSQLYKPYVSGEIYLSEDFQANVESGIEIKTIKKLILGNVTNHDELRMPYIEFDFSKLDSLFGGGQTYFAPKFTFSPEHFLGASTHEHPSAGRDGTGEFFFKYEQVLNRTQRMPFESYISCRTQFQTSSASMPSSEQLQIGGASSVRGYPEGEYLADIGAILNLEWVFPMYFVPRDFKLPYAEMPLRNQIQPVVFMDIGGGKIRRANAGEHPIRFLMGMGGGLRLSYNRNFSLRLDWAERLGDRPTQGQGPSNFYITLQCEV